MAEKSGVNKKDAAKALGAMLSSGVESVKMGEKVVLIGFFHGYQVKRKQHMLLEYLPR